LGEDAENVCRVAIEHAQTVIERELGWRPAETFATGLRRTVEWYLANQQWVEQVTTGAYRQWIDQNYAHRGSLAR